MTEMKGDIGARLNRLEAGQARNDQASVASSRSSPFRNYLEARTGQGCSMTMASLEEEVTPGAAQQYAAGLRQEIAEGAVGG